MLLLMLALSVPFGADVQDVHGDMVMSLSADVPVPSTCSALPRPSPPQAAPLCACCATLRTSSRMRLAEC